VPTVLRETGQHGSSLEAEETERMKGGKGDGVGSKRIKNILTWASLGKTWTSNNTFQIELAYRGKN
jgi:hypothetical protein